LLHALMAHVLGVAHSVCAALPAHTPNTRENIVTRRVIVPYVVAVFIVAVLLAPDHARAGASSRPVGSLIITGKIEDRVLLTFDQFEALPLPLQTVTVQFRAGQSEETHTFTGFLLLDVLNHFTPKFDPTVKNDKLRFYVSATGTDDYQAIVAWGEFDPGFENKPILLAVTQDGTSLAAEGIRLVVPDDIRGGRYVSLVDTVRLDRARQPGCPRHNFWWFFRHLPKC